MSITFTGVDYSASINHIGMYSDGTSFIKTDANSIAEYAHTMTVKPSTMNEFVTAMFLYDTVRGMHSRDMRLVLPYIPGARQDRSNPTGDVVFTLWSVANMINSRRFKEVVCLDPHSVMANNLITYLIEYPLELVAQKLWQGYGGIIAPDAGAKKRAEGFAWAMGLGVTYGSKHRDPSNGKLSGFDINVVAGRHYLVVDDICDGGRTFVGLGEKIREQGAFADLYVSHGIFTNGTRELKKTYKNIYTTDSRDLREDLDVLKINVVEDMVNYNESYV